jgi:hypothetical protein
MVKPGTALSDGTVICSADISHPTRRTRESCTFKYIRIETLSCPCLTFPSRASRVTTREDEVAEAIVWELPATEPGGLLAPLLGSCLCLCGVAIVEGIVAIDRLRIKGDQVGEYAKAESPQTRIRAHVRVASSPG